MKRILIVLVFLMVSCGSKKKASTVTKEKIKNEKDLSVFEDKTELSTIEFTRIADALIIEPNNPNKPIIINNDTIHNAKKVTFKKEKVDSTATVAKNETVLKEDKGTVIVDTSKKEVQIERDGFNWEGLKSALIWILVIIVVGGILYFRASGKRLFNKF